MSIQKQELAEGEIYHVVLRGVEQRKIFLNTDDYFRGIFSLYEFNTKKLVTIRERRIEREKFKRAIKAIKASRSPTPVIEDFRGELLVEILAFCLMPNHIHLLLRQSAPGGISKFIQKFGTGYANYFNKKYKRSGHLFQGKFRRVYIKNDNQLITVFVYIHANPVSIISPNWKEKGIKDFEKAIKFIETFKWSSFQDYLGKKNFPSLTKREFLLGVLDGKKNARKVVSRWLKFKQELADFKRVAIE